METISEYQSRYDNCLAELRAMLPEQEYHDILSQDMCELEFNFLGFVDVYKSLSELIPKHHIVIDFGCYLAAQSYFFSEHEQYIGVDCVGMKRFSPPNATHYVSSIQDFITNEVPKLFEEHNKLRYCAICSYVPDFKATEMVRNTFSNVFCYYPCSMTM